MTDWINQSRWEKDDPLSGRSRSMALIRRNDSVLMGWVEPYRGGGINGVKGLWITVANTPPFFQQEDGCVCINYQQKCGSKLTAKLNIHKVFERTENEDNRYELDEGGQIPHHWRHRHQRTSRSEQVENERGAFSGEDWE